MKLRLTKRDSASELLLIVMTWAIISLLSTRLFLSIYDYPQLGNGDWHVAHVLWGGLLMFLGMILVFGFHGERVKRSAAGIFGIGLGWFIDEIGKFLSANNDYFFQPAIVFMYAFFVVFFIIYRYVERHQPKDPKSLLYSSLNRIEEIIEGDFERREKRQIVGNLNNVLRISTDKKTRYFAAGLLQVVKTIEEIDDREESWRKRFWGRLRKYGYNKLFKRKIVLKALLALAFVYILGSIIDSFLLITDFRHSWLVEFFYSGSGVSSETDMLFFSLKTISDIIASLLFGLAIWWTKKGKKMRGVNFFQYGLLVNIFLSSVFRFYFEQFRGLIGLTLSVGVYYGLSRLKKDMVIWGKI